MAANESVSLTFEADLSALRKELAQVPGLTKKEADQAVKQLEVAYRKAEVAAKKAATAQANLRAWDRMNDMPELVEKEAKAVALAMNLPDVVAVERGEGGKLVSPDASGTSAAIRRTASSPAGVRSVTSSTAMPPATQARASGTACRASSSTITGTTGAAGVRPAVGCGSKISSKVIVAERIPRPCWRTSRMGKHPRLVHP
jgi:hypothetical protein